MEAEVKGAVLRGILKDVKEKSPGGIPNLMDALPEDIRTAHFEAPVLHGSWFPYRALGALLEAYSGLIAPNQPQIFREVGRRTAERDVNTLLKVYAAVSSPIRFADATATVWGQRFRYVGTNSVEKGDRSFRFTISGFPGIHPLHCELLTGYGQSTGLRAAKTFHAVHDRCVHRADGECSFLSRW